MEYASKNYNEQNPFIQKIHFNANEMLKFYMLSQRDREPDMSCIAQKGAVKLNIQNRERKKKKKLCKSIWARKMC